MVSRKIAVVMAACMVLGAMSTVPAQAGLGGCGSTAKAPAIRSGSAHASPFVDALRWLVPGSVLDYARALLQGGQAGSSHKAGISSTEGLGGCFSGICLCGLGGCKQ
jgi:hypothetical protein